MHINKMERKFGFEFQLFFFKVLNVSLPFKTRFFFLKIGLTHMFFVFYEMYYNVVMNMKFGKFKIN